MRPLLRQTYTPAEVAGLLRVHLSTVYRWIDAGRLPSVNRLGKPIRIPLVEFHQLFPELLPPFESRPRSFRQAG